MLTNHVTAELERLIKPVKALYISTYIPRKCGIATYTKDLTNAINSLNPMCKAEIAAMDNNHGLAGYPSEVKFIIKQEETGDYRKVVNHINKNGVDVVSLQHEFGIYGGSEGSKVLDFVERIKKPIVTTFHTVLEQPTDTQKRIIQRISSKSSAVVVMLSTARQLLIDTYAVPYEKIVVIHHGVPDFAKLDSEIMQRKIRKSRYTIMTSVNLISPSRGLEYAIQSIPDIVKNHPNFLYLIIGVTHPEFLKWVGGKDIYRDKLKKMVKSLGMESHVRFINKYVSLDELIKYVHASDFYITPYLEKQQAASGALAYAIGAGKACISTPYLYAREMLGNGRGVLVPFRDSKMIGKKVNDLLANKDKKMRIEQKAYEIGRRMIWSNIAHQYFHLFHEIKE